MSLFRPRRAQAKAVDYVLGFGRVVASRVEGAAKAVLLSIRGLEGDVDEDHEDSEGEGIWSALGLVGRPKKTVRANEASGTNPAGYCEVIGGRFGDSFAPMGCRDLRINAKVNPKEGQLFFAQYGGGFLSLEDASDGRGTLATLYAPHLSADGTTEKANALMLDPAQGACALVQQDGSALTLTADGAVMKSVGGSFVEVNDQQVKLSAPNVFAYTGSFILYVPNENNTQAHAISVENSDGSMTLLHRTGASIFMNSVGQIVMKSPLGGTVLTLDEDGLFLNGNLKVQGSALFGVGPPGAGQFAIGPTLAAIPTVPVPLSAVLRGITGVSGAPSLSAFVYS